VTVIVEVYY